MIISAHQPNFMPYLGFWHKVKIADIFVILDDVDFTYKNNDSYTHRTLIAGYNGQRDWLTLGVEKKSRTAINKIDFRPLDWLSKYLCKFENAYNDKEKYPFMPDIRRIITVDVNDKSLSYWNVQNIISITSLLHIDTSFVLSSSLDYDRTLTKDYKLKAIFDSVCGSSYTYYSGHGAKDYMVNNLFDVQWSNFVYKPYCDDFICGLSILDYLVRYGFNGINDYI